MESTSDIKRRIIDAGYAAVEELINVAKDKILTGKDDDLSADKLKNAAATKRLAIEDAFQILNRIESEKEILDGESGKKETSVSGFAERNSK